MSDAIDLTSCIQHTGRYFIYFEDFQDAAPEQHKDKVAAFLRVLEVKANKIIIAYSLQLEDALKNGDPVPTLNLWTEVSYSDFVFWALETKKRSSFQIADKEAKKSLFVKSRVKKCPARTNVPSEQSPQVEYKEYLLVIPNVQAAIDGKELPITGEAFEKYGEEGIAIEDIPLLKKTRDMFLKTREGMLQKTGGRVENNRLLNKDNNNPLSKDKDSFSSSHGSDDTQPSLSEVLEQLRAIQQENARLREEMKSLSQQRQPEASLERTEASMELSTGGQGVEKSVADVQGENTDHIAHVTTNTTQPEQQSLLPVEVPSQPAQEQPNEKGKGKGRKGKKAQEDITLTDEDRARIAEEKAKEQALAERKRGILARIVARRGYELTTQREIAAENTSICWLAEKYSNAQIDAIHKYLFEREKYWSLPEHRYKIGACIIRKEGPAVAQVLRDERLEKEQKKQPKPKPSTPEQVAELIAELRSPDRVFSNGLRPIQPIPGMDKVRSSNVRKYRSSAETAVAAGAQS